jgi:hypothetical protein
MLRIMDRTCLVCISSRPADGARDLIWGAILFVQTRRSINPPYSLRKRLDERLVNRLATLNYERVDAGLAVGGAILCRLDAISCRS